MDKEPEYIPKGKFVRYDDVQGHLQMKLAKGFQRANEIGYECMKGLYSMQRGSTTFIYGDPFSGKSKIWFQGLKNTATQYNSKHVIFSPETGSAEDIYEELVCMYAKNRDYYSLKESDVGFYSQQIRDNFFVIDSVDEDLTATDIMAHVEEQVIKMMERNRNFKRFDTLTIDPFNELKINYGGEPRDEVVSNLLGNFRRFCRKKDIHGCIITHTRDRKGDRKKGKAIRNGQERDIEYYPIPNPNDMLHGPTFFRKGMMILAVWRPPLGFLDPDGVEFPPNTTLVEVQKFKPRGYGGLGIGKLYLNVDTNEFEEMIAQRLHGPWGYSEEINKMVQEQEVDENLRFSR